MNKFAEKAGIEAKISSHVARHNFADYARRRIKDITIVRDLLGHISVNVTENYLRSLDKTELESSMINLFT